MCPFRKALLPACQVWGRAELWHAVPKPHHHVCGYEYIKLSKAHQDDATREARNLLNV